jgi:CheY-like chemotaxis protein
VEGDHILIVDDNPTNRKPARVLLTSEGYQVHTAINAEEGLALLQLAHHRLILLDFQFPGVEIISSYPAGSGPASGAQA